MRDARMTLPRTTRQLINGDDHELRVTGDRATEQHGELVRKSDSHVLARLRFGRGTAIEPTHRARLTRGAMTELSDLLARWRAGDDSAAHASFRQARRVARILRRLGIDDDMRAAYRPPACLEPARLVEAGADLYRRPLWLTAGTARAWSRLHAAAQLDRVALHAVSGYRSVDYQAALIARKLARGQSMETILAISALPGHSEHHLGTVLDIHDGAGSALEESFGQSSAFAWLRTNAGRFGFVLSYPRDNPWGIAYEPWHWRYQDGPAARQGTSE